MNFFRDHINKILLTLVTAGLIAAMAFSAVGKPNAGLAMDTFGFVMKPIQSFFAYIGDCFSYGADSEKYAQENSRLKQELIIANKHAKDYEELVEENNHLRAMLELKKSDKDYTLTAASVIAVDTDDWTSVYKLDKGLGDGIKKLDPVITEDGLVGYISEVGRHWSKVVTILDPSVSVSSVIERNDEYCIVEGDASLMDDDYCRMKYATKESSISAGDILITSGEGEIYPKDIIIGKITEILVNTNGISQDAIVEPMVDFADLNEVFVIVD